MPLDILSFRSVQGSTGFVRIRESDPSQIKRLGKTPFFGKIVAFFSKPEQNKEVKREFLALLEQDYGPHFREIAEGAVDPNSGKPLKARVVRDLLAMGDAQELQEKTSTQPTETFELREGLPEPLTLNCLVATDRSEITEGSERFIQSGGIGRDGENKGFNFLSDIGSIFNANRPFEDTANSREVVGKQREYIARYGDYGFDLLRSFVYARHNKVDDRLQHILSLNQDPETGAARLDPLTAAYCRRFDVDDFHAEPMDSPVRLGPSSIMTDFPQLFGQLGVSLKQLQKHASEGKEALFKFQAAELLKVAQGAMARFDTAGKVLTSDEFLNSIPDEHREPMRALGEQYKAIHAQMTTPGGAFQDMLSFCVESVEHPKKMMAVSGFKLPFSPEGLKLELNSSNEEHPLLLSGSATWELDEAKYKEKCTNLDYRPSVEAPTILTWQFVRDLKGAAVTLVYQRSPEDGDGASEIRLPERDGVGASEEMMKFTGDQNVAFNLTKLLTQEMLAPIMTDMYESNRTVLEISTDPFEEGERNLQFSVRQDGESYVIDCQLKGLLTGMNDGLDTLELNNGLGSTVETTFSIEVLREDLSKDVLSPESTKFEVISPPTVTAVIHVDPNNMRR